jgi:hypothetical protein
MKSTYHNQASIEEARYPVDFTDSLLTAVTVSSAVATHVVYPSGSALTITTSVSSPIVYVNVPTGLAVGTNVIRIVATTSDGLLSPAHELIITTRS